MSRENLRQFVTHLSQSPLLTEKEQRDLKTAVVVDACLEIMSQPDFQALPKFDPEGWED